MSLRDWKLRLRALTARRRVERDLDDELSFHVEREARKLIDEGMRPDRARATARARFGSAALVAEECRDQRGTAFVDDTIRDVRFALRSFRRAPLTAFTIVTTIAIGVGIVAVLFTLLNRFLFRVDAVPEISQMYGVERAGPGDGAPSSFTRPAFEALRRETSVFTDAYAAVSVAAALATILIAVPAGAVITESVRVTDPIAYAASVLVIVAACLLAAWIPAARAARLDPMRTLRQE